MSVTFLVQGSEFSINLSNRNAMMVLRYLGFEEPDWCGEIHNVPGFMARCQEAMLTIQQFPDLDAPVATVEDQQPGKAKVIEFGLPEGYLLQRISELQALAFQAYELNKPIIWC